MIFWNFARSPGLSLIFSLKFLGGIPQHLFLLIFLPGKNAPFQQEYSWADWHAESWIQTLLIRNMLIILHKNYIYGILKSWHVGC